MFDKIGPELARLIDEQDHGGEAFQLSSRLQVLEQRLDEVAESYARGGISARAFERASATIEGDREAARGRLARLTSSGYLAAYRGQVGALRASWPSLTLDQRRAVIGAVVATIAVAPGRRGYPAFDAGRISVEWRQPS